MENYRIIDADGHVRESLAGMREFLEPRWQRRNLFPNDSWDRDLRGKLGAKPEGPRDQIAAISSASDEAETHDLEAQVISALEALPLSRRTAVRMYLSGYDREEIADLLGWTEAKTRNLLYRGLDYLRGRLNKMGITWPPT